MGLNYLIGGLGITVIGLIWLAVWQAKRLGRKEEQADAVEHDLESAKRIAEGREIGPLDNDEFDKRLRKPGGGL